MTKLIETIGQELGVRAEQVDAAVRLLDEGATVPFIARYRKEATGGLDDAQLRQLHERLHYLRELEERRGVVLASIEEQGKLDADLRAAIEATATKQQLEDLYLPYKPKRRTKAQLAREAGLGPLAEDLLADPRREPLAEAFAYVDPEKGVTDAAAALDGARYILMERFAEDPALAGELRERLWEQGVMVSRVVEGKEQEGKKFSDYFDYREPVAKIPSHRALALFRGRKQGALSLELLPEDAPDPDAYYRSRVAAHFGIRSQGHAGDYWLEETVRKAWRAKLFTRLELDIKNRLMDAAQAEAIRVFALNLKALLLAAPAGGRATLGLDPGLRTGVKVAVVDTTGRLVDTATIYPHAPRKQWDAAIARLAELCKKHDVELVSIGNGTASRETDRLVRELIRGHPELGLRSQMVNEAGASVYSASELASREFPDIDVSLRGAVSIARRLQDPLAELVKIEPKSIGVGQYQHDVNQSHLARTLDTVVEDCVNAVGVDLNTASVALLTRVSGLNRGLAEHIVGFRETNGAFSNRVALMAVPRFGDKAFQQSAGFLRIRDGEEPLDRSAVHPEAYPVVRRICDHTGKDVGSLMGNTATLQGLDPLAFVDDRFGVPTVKDILAELEKPGRDPRPEFRTADHREGIESLEDLKPDMVLEGTVTNVTNFGAFVDIGVHQDGLVHISRLAEGFVKDPHSVVKSGQLVKVKVLEVDLARRRIALSMRLREASEAASASGEGRARTSEGKPPPRPRARQPEQKRRETARREGDKGRTDNGRSALEGAFAAAFERARKQ